MENIFEVKSSNKNLDNILSNQIYYYLSSNSMIPEGLITHIFELAKSGFKDNLFTNFYGLIKEYKNMLEVALQNGKNDEWTRNYICSLIKIIDFYIKDIDYENKLKNELSKYDNRVLSIRNVEDLGFIINYSLTTIPQEYILLYLRNVIYYHKDMSTNLARKIVIDFVSNYAIQNNTKCNVAFRSRNDVCGYYREHVVSISTSLVDDFSYYPYSGSCLLFNTIFHEFEHLFQSERLHTKVYPSYDEIVFFKDFLLSYTNMNYYNGNYPYILFELYARIKADRINREFIDYLGAYYMVDKYNAENDINRHNSRGRVANGRLVDIDVVFDENISEIIKYVKNSRKRFPFLSLIYDSHGKRRTSYKLFRDRNALKKALDSGDDREEISKLIEEINVILDNQVLSSENAIRDSEEILEHCGDNAEMIEYALRLKRLAASKPSIIETISRVTNYTSCLSNEPSKKHERKLTDSTKLNL